MSLLISDNDLQAHLDVILENPEVLKKYEALAQGVHNQSPDLGHLKSELTDTLKALPHGMPERIAKALPGVIEAAINDNRLAAPKYVQNTQPKPSSSRTP